MAKVFTCEVTIRRPRDVVLELLRTPELARLWQPGLVGVELLSGQRDQAGARYRVIYTWAGVRLQMIETVIKHEPPELFVSSFASSGVRNLVENRFHAQDENLTRWVSVNTLRLTGMMAVAGLFLNEVVPRQVADSMNAFRRVAEGG